jgi:hypothetical protein
MMLKIRQHIIGEPNVDFDINDDWLTVRLPHFVKLLQIGSTGRKLAISYLTHPKKPARTLDLVCCQNEDEITPHLQHLASVRVGDRLLHLFIEPGLVSTGFMRNNMEL